MQTILLFLLSGAIGWGLGALLLLAFVHALTHAMATRMGLPLGPRPIAGPGSLGLGAWPSAGDRPQLAPGGELREAGRQRGESGQGERREQHEAPAT